MTRQPSVSVAARRNMSRSRHQRNAVSVFPLPVGARMRVFSPRAIAGQPSLCGAVGCSKTARNHAAVTGWKRPRASSGWALVSRRVRFFTAIVTCIKDSCWLFRVAPQFPWAANPSAQTRGSAEFVLSTDQGWPYLALCEMWETPPFPLVPGSSKIRQSRAASPTSREKRARYGPPFGPC